MIIKSKLNFASKRLTDYTLCNIASINMFLMKKNLLITQALCSLCYASMMFGQQPVKPTSGEIYKSLEKLNFLGNALFVAAHPDDENTRLISYLANEVNAHTTYLSITRGDGGQNLIGPEIQELLGVIRTQELLQARKVDGGNQMFTRANDFGFSKNAEETISIWDSELVKQDVVWAIRNLRPDVIINRFDHRTSGSTHGHHTASAVLAHELFEKAADKTAYSDQLKMTEPWKAQRLFFNISWFFFGSQEAFNKADKSKFMTLEVGNYYPLLGKSNGEIAALSRSKHKCQGFGSTGNRGVATEYLELLKGDLPTDKTNVFDGINTTWTRVKGGEKIKAIMDDVMATYDFRAPHKSVPKLVTAAALIEKIEDKFWRDRKSKEINDVIATCLGLYFDASTNTHTAVPGSEVKVDIELTKRMPGNVIVKGIKLLPAGKDTSLNVSLANNEAYLQSFNYKVLPNEELTNPYWLNENGSKGMYNVSKPELIGKPETPRNIKAEFLLEIDGKLFTLTKFISHKFNNPEEGETYAPFEITPEVFVKFDEKVYIFGNEFSKKVKVIVTAGANNQSGAVALPVSAGWKVSPASIPFTIKDKGNSQEVIFEVTPPSGETDLTLTPVATTAAGKMYNRQLIQIKYDHIPTQTIMQPAESRLVKLDIKTNGNKIAFIPGAGDEVAQSLKQIGYDVTIIEAKDIKKDELKNYDAVIMGVRAYNTNEDLKFKQEAILDYVYQGGTLLVQYNTNNRLTVGANLGPYNLKVGRERVTVEEAPIRVLAPEHAVLNTPNKITSKDFDGWIQERGLYFASEWDTSKYVAILSCNDPNEPARDGGLLVAKHGKGNFIYTGYSWFRQLPAGVPGAFRIFANMVSLGKQPSTP
jgi:LmbE family N-acetylglucosaminyl deacetylase